MEYAVKSHPDLSEEGRRQELRAIQARREARAMTRRKWDEIDRVLHQSEDQCGIYRQKTDLLKTKLQSARSQIGTQAAAIVTVVVGNDVNAIMAAAELEDFHLEPLDTSLISERLNLRQSTETPSEPGQPAIETG